MKFKNVALAAHGHYLPQNIMTSEMIEEDLAEVYQGLKLPTGRLELMSGIKERRYFDVGARPSHLAAMAAKDLASKNPEVDLMKTDLLIHASVCRDFLEPATASVIHHELGLPEDCEFFDLSNACLGVMSAINMAAKLIELGDIKQALIVSGENAAPLYEATKSELIKKFRSGELTRKNIKPYIANLTIGSAAVAVLVTSADLAPHADRFLGAELMSDSSANTLCQGSGDTSSLMMETNSEELLKAGIKLAKKTWQKTVSKLGLKPSDIHWAIGHQVGVAHEKLTMESLELSKHPTHITYDTLGNTGSAALPITYMKLVESGKVQPGQHIAMLGIGSGLSSLMAITLKGSKA